MASIGQTLFRFGGALLLGASATAIDNPRPLWAPQASAPVLVAAKDIPEGMVVDRAAVVVAQWPVGTIPAGAYASIDSVAGRVTRRAVFKGEALMPGRLAPEGTGPGLEVKITPGKRAVSFRINDVSGIAGLIQPNSRVDVLLVTDDGAKGKVAKLFMENMRVLAIGAARADLDDPQARPDAVVTIEVTPEEGDRLGVAKATGWMQVMLRGYGDPDSSRAAVIPPSSARTCDPNEGRLFHDLLQRGCARVMQFSKTPAPPEVNPRVESPRR